MNFPIFPLFCTFLFHNSLASFEDDLQTLLDFHNPKGSKCVFNQSEITSKTIDFFPKCQKVYGLIIINSNTDLSLAQLTKAFENMTALYGGIRVENSNLTSSSFLTVFMFTKFELYCETYGVFIENNRYLNDAKQLQSINQIADEATKECKFRVNNNPKLNMEDVCRYYGLASTTVLEARCQGNQINTTSISEFKKCTTTYNGLQFSNISDVSSQLAKIDSIRGPINIQNSEIQNLSFLESWRNWIPRSSKTLAFNLQNNPNMTRLGMSLKICEEYDIKDAVVCRLESLKDLPNNCEMIVGNLNVGPGDEEYFSKLQGVTHLFGSFTIENTNLVNLGYLENLYYIASLDEFSPVIKFVSNPRLRLIRLLSIKNIITRGNRDAILQDNHPDIFKTKSGKQVKCAVAEWIGMSDDTYPVDLNFVGGDCDGFFLENNKYLNETSIINNLSTTNYEDFNDCDFEINNNPLLDFWDACYYNSLTSLINLTTSGNLYNCGCQGDQIANFSFEKLQSCQTYYKGIKLHNFTETTNLTSFNKIRTIRGFLDIQNTNIQNLSFLESFKYLRAYSDGEVVFNLQNNPNMTRLALPVFEDLENFNLYGSVSFNFENLHPDFCITANELESFHNFDVRFINLQAKLCDIFDEGDVICHFESMSKLPNNCRYIIGNVVIDSGEENDVTKLAALRYLYGTLTIRNTQLVDLSFFKRLYFIAVLDESQPIVQILSNKNLTNPKIGDGFFHSIFTRSFDQRDAIIQDNHPSMFSYVNGTCNLFGIIPNERVMYRRSLNYTGGDCGERVEIKFCTANLGILAISIWLCLLWSIENM
ncbi:hypothetical protein B9Z55_017867 [Caenorhabditis nigoni]|uniref:Receptor L-domain domain-containing protein n=1 Tax=Caenorhabditis nigoni TaxID=1611254 RepID=A0A2G5TBE2_9PELO|nr:hypothetical protein B9Z55_017867 [Caenorhabditis nigoni]